MVPGSTLRYGSSFWRETVRWRAFRMFPIDAAVMPFPSEETTPPVTKTYFDIETSRAVLTMLPALRAGGDQRFTFAKLTFIGRPHGRARRTPSPASGEGRVIYAIPSGLPLALGRPPWFRSRRTTTDPTASAEAPPRSRPSPSGTGRWDLAPASSPGSRSAWEPRTSARAGEPPPRPARR